MARQTHPPSRQDDAHAPAPRPAFLPHSSGPGAAGRSNRAVITGLVFQDFNANGAFDTAGSLNNSGTGTIHTAVDHGLAGVAVTAYNAAGAAAATAVTAANGTFTLAGTAAGQSYRVEFTNLPAGFSPGPHGANDGTTVQFVNGGASNVDLGLVQPAAYSVNNPLLVTSQYWFGNPQTGPNANQATLVGVTYSAGSAFNDPSASTSANYTTPALQTLATLKQVGATWGVTYDAQNQTVYAAAFFKKHTGFGPDGPGAIYQIPITFNPATGAATAGAPTLLTTLNAGPNDHDTSDYDTDNGNTGWNAVGQTSLGGMAVSPDGSTLYVMNLFDRKLYVIPTADPANARAVTLPVPGDATGANGADLRPFAVTYYNGLVYVGMVNSAESTQNRNDLHAYVYSYNPTTGVFTKVLEIADLAYTRSYAENFHQVASADWLPWSPTYKSLVTDNTVGVYPQPMLTGIAFDASGDMVLGLRDRAGDQFGFFTHDDPSAPNVQVQGVGAGDTLLATPSGSGWAVESDIYANAPTHFFSDQSWESFHTAVMVGGVVNVPGFPDVVVSAFDAANTSQPRTGGLRWFNDSTGAADKAYTIYATSMTNNDPSAETFGKANGIGGLTYVTPPAPLEIGNRVWLDLNGNGVQDANEPGIQGVHVNLSDANGNLVGSTTTDASGDYYFNAGDVTNHNGVKGIIPGAVYTVRLNDPADYAVGGPLYDLRPTAAGAGPDPAVDSNGVPVGPTDVRAAVTAGGVGQSDDTIDFGFTYNLSLGGLVWRDANNNGVVDAGEAGIAGVPVELYSGGLPVLGQNGQPVTTTTDATGHYLFTGLNPGSYQVRILPPAGYISSSGTPGSRSGPYEPGLPGTNFTNNADHGTTWTDGSILTGPVTLALPGSASNPDDGGTANLRQDFGLWPINTLSLGGLVWRDSNNNGVVDAGEAGIASVPVELYSGVGLPFLSPNGQPVTTTTDATGHYLFTGLNPGVYIVRILPPAGDISSTGATGSPYGPYEPGLPGTNFTNNADHGREWPDGSILAGPVTLGLPGSAANPDDQGTANLRQDFGLFPVVTIRSTVWNDVNGNGILDPGEAGIAGVTVDLYSASGQLLATAVTNAEGQYVFSNDPRLPNSPSEVNGVYGLTPDASYVVRLDNPANYQPGGPLAGFDLTKAFAGPSNVDSTGALVNGVVTADVFTGNPGSTTLVFNFGFYDYQDPGLLSKRGFIH